MTPPVGGPWAVTTLDPTAGPSPDPLLDTSVDPLLDPLLAERREKRERQRHRLTEIGALSARIAMEAADTSNSTGALMTGEWSSESSRAFEQRADGVRRAITSVQIEADALNRSVAVALAELADE